MVQYDNMSKKYSLMYTLWIQLIRILGFAKRYYSIRINVILWHTTLSVILHQNDTILKETVLFEKQIVVSN